MTAQNALSPEDIDFIKRLIESAHEPLEQLHQLVDACSSRGKISSGDVNKRGSRFSVSYAAWMKSKPSISRIQKKLRGVHRNINTALTALNCILRLVARNTVA
jgi:hypothetical protein